jgi:alanyl aminopeptidase
MSRIFHFAIFPLLLIAADAAADDRLGTDVVPFHQAVNLTIDPAGDDYSGSTQISLEVRAEAPEIRLHADGIEITSLRLGLGGEALPATYSVEEDVLTVAPSSPLAPGKYSLLINFSNAFNTQAVGLYRMESEDLGYAYTQFEATDARKAFPCFDEPSFKIPFQLNITAPEGNAVVTNTPLHSETGENGWKTLEFGTTPPLPTYLLAIAVGPMDSVEIPDLPVPGRVYTPKGKAGLAPYAAAMIAPILQAQQRYFGMAYPYEKLDFLAVPEYWPGAMEHPGAITFSDSIILLDSEQVSAGQRRTAARVISHELAHQWFGNLVTMEWWDDLWLNESFADWFGDKITMELYPETKSDLVELRNVNRVMTNDSRVTSEPIHRPISSPAEMFSSVGVAYNKGKSVIGMFERWIGEDAFRSGVNAYLLKNAWGNAQSDAFWQALTDAAGADVASSMETFLVQAGVPLVEATIEGNLVQLRQKRFSNSGTELEDQSWRIPVGLRVGVKGEVLDKTVLLTESEMQLEIEGVESIDWVMPNSDGAGYYRWSIGDEALQAIAPGADRILNERERVAFLGNLGALLDAGGMGGDTYMKSLEAFATDPEPFVVSAVVSELRGVQNTFVTKNLREEFAGYLGKTLSPAIERFGIDARPGEDETVAGFRPRLLYWLGMIAGEEGVISWGVDAADRYMEDSASVDPALAGVALRIKAKSGSPELFDQFAARFQAAENPSVRANYLSALGAFENPVIREKALTYVLEGPLRPNEIFNIPAEIFNAYDGKNLVFDWLMSNFEEVSSRLPPVYVPFLPQFGGGCDAGRLNEAKAFFTKPENIVEGTEKQMEKTEASVLDCISLRNREGENVRNYLQGS